MGSRPSEERWAAIPGYEGRYEASTLGRIRSLRRRNRNIDEPRPEPLVLKQATMPQGYMLVDLAGRTRRVHRLVLAAFRGDSPLEANHIDHDPGNNRLENLEYVTRSENVLHSVKAGRWRQHGEHNGMSKLTAESAAEVDRLLSARVTQRAIADRFGVSTTTIMRVSTGRSWSHITGRGR